MPRSLPGRSRLQIVESAGRVAGRVHPQQPGTGGIVGIDPSQIEREAIGHRHPHHPAAGQLGAHSVGGIGDRRDEHGVPAAATSRPEQ